MTIDTSPGTTRTTTDTTAGQHAGGATTSPTTGEAGAVPRLRWGARRRRVLVVHSSDELYGSDRVVAELVAELAARDDLDVSVWLPTDVDRGPLGPLLRDLGARVEHVPLPVLRRRRMRGAGPLALLRDAALTRARLAAARPDLVWCATSACLVVAPLARSVGVPRVVGHLQEQWAPGDHRVLAPLARSLTAVVGVSRSVLTASGLAGDPRSVVVQDAVPSRDARPVPGTTERAARWVVASRWAEGKGHATLLTAWDAAGCPGELVVLGGPPAAGAAVDVPGLVAALVSDPATVTVVGEVADPGPWVRAADAVVLPTDAREGFGLVAVEAFSEGRAVVASRCGGPEEIVEHGVTGWLFEPGDVDGLARLFATLDVADLAAAGRRATAVHREHFTTDAFRRRVLSVVDRELELARAPRPRAARPDAVVERTAAPRG